MKKEVVHNLKIGLRWFFGVNFYLAGMGMLFIYPLASIGFFLAGTFCIPPILEAIELKLGAQFKTGFKYAVVIGGYMLSALIGAPVMDQESEQAVETTAASKDTTSTSKDTVVASPSVQATKAETKPTPEPEQIPMSARVPEEEPQQEVEQRPRHTYKSKGYIRGPRGGCYYINAYGNKVYVDRSLCD